MSRFKRHMPARQIGLAAVASAVLWTAAGTVQAQQAKQVVSLERIKELREQAAHRERRIIIDNDGNEVVYYLKEATPKALLDARTTALVGTGVDTIVYCTWSSGFSIFTHNTKIGEVFDCTAKEPKTGKKGFSWNKTRDFIEQGTDCLEIVVDFCKKKDMEIFWSFRMNDTHDAWGGWYSPFLFPKLKKEHPEWLVSSKEKRAKVGGWSAVNYAVPEIRDLAFRFIEEVCQNYNVDGVLMDFFRHPVYFKSHAWGKPCSQAERDMMTDLLRRVRKMADRRGAERGRPILVSARTPDSVDYCRAMGLDVERWMRDDLIDIWVVSGYFRLNPWEPSVKLAHQYDVPVYPSLSETRFRDKQAKKIRGSLASYRGRAMNVWNAGADGIFMFNYHNAKSPLWREIGSPETIAKKERVYTTGARGVRVVNRWMVGGMKFLNRSPISPETPRKLTPGKAASAVLRVGEDMAKTTPSGLELQLRFKGLISTDDVTVTLNGKALDGLQLEKNLLTATPDRSTIRRGENKIEVALSGSADKGVVWEDLALWVRP